MADFVIKEIKDIDEAKQVWKKISPNRTLYDTWEFRFCFYKYYNYPVQFLAGYSEGELVGLLPLEYNQEKKHLEFFGTYFMETNQVYIRPGFERYIPAFYEYIKKSAELEGISEQDEFTAQLPLGEYKYVLELEKYSGLQQYLETAFSSKSRSNLKKKLREIECEDNVVEMKKGTSEDLELLFDLNIKSFEYRGTDTSSFLFPFRKDIYRDFLKLPFEYDLAVLYINGKKEAVSFSFLYKDTYVFLNTGANLEAFSNLGTYMYIKNIERAFEAGAKYFDAGMGAYNWKERFHLTKIPQHTFVK